MSLTRTCTFMMKFNNGISNSKHKLHLAFTSVIIIYYYNSIFIMRIWVYNAFFLIYIQVNGLYCVGEVLICIPCGICNTARASFHCSYVYSFNFIIYSPLALAQQQQELCKNFLPRARPRLCLLCRCSSSRGRRRRFVAGRRGDVTTNWAHGVRVGVVKCATWMPARSDLRKDTIFYERIFLHRRKMGKKKYIYVNIL